MKVYDDLDMWGFFANIIASCLHKYAPLKKVCCKHSKGHNPWLSLDILSAIHEKQKAKCIAKKSGNDDNIALYKCHKNDLKTTIHSAKLHFLEVNLNVFLLNCDHKLMILFVGVRRRCHHLLKGISLLIISFIQ